MHRVTVNLASEPPPVFIRHGWGPFALIPVAGALGALTLLASDRFASAGLQAAFHAWQLTVYAVCLLAGSLTTLAGVWVEFHPAAPPRWLATAGRRSRLVYRMTPRFTVGSGARWEQRGMTVLAACLVVLWVLGLARNGTAAVSGGWYLAFSAAGAVWRGRQIGKDLDLADAIIETRVRAAQASAELQRLRRRDLAK